MIRFLMLAIFKKAAGAVCPDDVFLAEIAKCGKYDKTAEMKTAIWKATPDPAARKRF